MQNRLDITFWLSKSTSNPPLPAIDALILTDCVWFSCIHKQPAVACD
jgi:hypothetical protein